MILIAPRLYAIGTHHKTGTLWMRAVFKGLARATGVPLTNVYPRTPAARAVPEDDRAILTSWSSTFPDWLHDRPDARILHVIRDPRDVLLSGARYHAEIAPKGEPFLHEPRDDLGGRSYHQHIASLPTRDARLLFEMQGKHAETLAQMTGWTYDAPNTIEARYEDLVAPGGDAVFREHLRDLGLPEPEVTKGVDIFRANSLTGGLADPGDRPDRIRAHVGNGAARQWRAALPRAVAERYAEAHGDALVQLGYEDHPTAWLGNLRDAA